MDPNALPQLDDASRDPTATTTELDPDGALLRKLKIWFRRDREHSSKWREKAREDYDFAAVRQWSEDDKQKLKDQLRVPITFDRISPMLRTISGEQINSPQEIRYQPRQPNGEQMPAEGAPPDIQASVTDALTSTAEWFRDQCDADDEESEMFLDSAICGMGWTETRLDTDTDPQEPNPIIERIDPLEMYWDSSASKRNLTDRRRQFRVRTMTKTDAQALLPDVPEEDLHASWADVLMSGEDEPRANDGTSSPWYSVDKSGRDAGKDGTRDEDPVILVHAEWREREAFHMVADPWTGQVTHMSDDQHETLQDRLAQLGHPAAPSTRMERYVYKQAYIGRTVLQVGPSRYPEGWTYNCITAYRDRNKGTWFGLVRSMKDPQRWANKWLSQTLHILNSNAKGGIIAETGIAENIRDFEDSYAKSDRVTWVNPGVLERGMIKDKPTGQLPAGFYQLMEFAVSSIRDTVGINLEMIGQREGDQPATLEYMRHQAGLTILAQLFRSMRRYHRIQGKLLLYFIQNYLADGRLVRIVGKNGAQYVPLMRQADVKYDIVVDEGPSSPNEKERIWQLIGDKLWTLPQDMQMILLDYSPFPESIVAKIKQSQQQQAQNPQTQLQQRMMAAEAQLAEMRALLAQAQAAKAGAEAQRAQQPQPGPGGPDIVGAHTDLAKAQLAAQTDMLKHRNKLITDSAIQRERTMARLTADREKMAGQMTLDREHQALEHERHVLEHGAAMAGHHAGLFGDVVHAASRHQPHMPPV